MQNQDEHSLFMYEVLDKDTTKSEISPLLSSAKQSYVSQSGLVEVIQCIRYKLKICRL